MATSDAQKRATEKYAKTEKGKLVRKKALDKYFSTEQGRQKLKEAQQRFEATEARKIYQREWKRKKRQDLKNQNIGVDKSD